MADHIRYDLLTQQALRGVVRSVLSDAAKKGLPGDHHFFITFDTTADGVRIADRLRAQFPEEMTIILQHQFWHLTVTERGFEVDLTFGGIMERLSIPFEAVNRFVDPSVQFGLEFAEDTEGQGQQAPANAQDKTHGKAQDRAHDRGQDKPHTKAREKSHDAPAKKRRPPALVDSLADPEPAAPALTVVPDPKSDRPEKPDRPSGGGEVVRLDRFRKK